MLKYATLQALLCEVAREHGIAAAVSQTSHNLLLNLDSLEKVETVLNTFEIRLDDTLAEVLASVLVSDSKSVVTRQLEALLKGSSKSSLGFIPYHLNRYDDMFWHFNNGYTGLSAYQQSRFVNWAVSNRIKFYRDGGAELSAAQVIASRPDVYYILSMSLCIALMIQDTLYRISSDKETFLSALRWADELGSLTDIHGVLIDEFRWSMLTIKGLSKSCGEWAVMENRAALYDFSSLWERVARTTRAAYSVTPDVIEHWGRNVANYSMHYFRYLNQYASICLVLQSLNYWSVVSDEYTPVERIAASKVIILKLGRVLHKLFNDSRELLNAEVDYVGDC